MITKLSAVLVALLLATAVPAQASDDPVEVVQSAADELAAALRERRDELTEDKKALYAFIDTILDPRFDRRYAAQLVLAKHWRSASDKQRTAFIEAFYQSMLRRYADGVLKFDEDRMEVLPYKAGKSKKRTTVKTEVVLDDGTKVPVNYGLVRRKSGWKVYDVTIEGISYVRNFRSELNSEISAKGLDDVIARLNADASKS